MSFVSLFVFAFVLVSASADVKPKISADVQPITSLDPSDFLSDLDVIHKIVSRDVYDYDDEGRFGLIIPCFQFITKIIHKVLRVVLHIPKRIIRAILCVARNVLLFPLKVIRCVLEKPTINGLDDYPTYPTQYYPTYPPLDPYLYQNTLPPKSPWSFILNIPKY